MAYCLRSRTVPEKIVEGRLDLGRREEDSGSDDELNKDSESFDSMHLVKPLWCDGWLYHLSGKVSSWG